MSTLMGMAKTAELGSNNAEALEYYNRALEIDPTIVEAWIGKGKAAAWQSSLVHLRLSEAVIAFQHAISNSDNDHHDIVGVVTGELNALVAALYRVARDHLEQFASLDQTWASYLNQVAHLLDALEHAREWSPRDRTTLENIVHLTADNIEGYKYWDNIHNVTGLHSITPEYERTLSDMRSSAIATLKEIDENYQPPAVEKKQSGACFVVTATMGDPNHPDVVLLRHFRDDWIAKRRWGRRAIAWYYRVGPTLAGWLQQSATRRRMSYAILVRPAVYLARRLIARS